MLTEHSIYAGKVADMFSAFFFYAWAVVVGRSLRVSCALHLAALSFGGKPAVTGFVTNACGEEAW